MCPVQCIGFHAPASKPIHGLPIEILADIFLNCLPTGTFPRFNPIETPLVLTQVCQRWRNIALSTGKLWSCFKLSIDHDSSESACSRQDHVLEIVDIWIRRARGYPLSVQLSCEPRSYAAAEGVRLRAMQVLCTLVPYAARWRQIELIMPSAFIFPLQRAAVQLGEATSPFVELQCLKIDMRGVRTPGVPLDICSMDFNWGNLTELHLHLDNQHTLSVNNCHWILSKSRKLRRCYMTVDCEPGSMLKDYQKIDLPQLTSLNLQWRGGLCVGRSPSHLPCRCLANLLDSIELSSLTNFKIGWVDNTTIGYRWSDIHAQFLAFLLRHARSVQSLHLYYLPIYDTHLLAFLKSLPLLRHLEVHSPFGHSDPDPITDQIFILLGNTARLPHLQALTLQCHGYRFTETALVTMVESRLNSLNQFSFLSLYPVTGHLRDKAKYWGTKGIDVHIDWIMIR